ncbi:MAG: phage/plasmid primase, P4 family [Enterococcus sp.]
MISILTLKTPPYLQELIKTIDPQKISNEYVYNFGKEALREFSLSIELENEGLPKSLHKRLPGQLPNLDTAVILSHLYTFKKIHMSGKKQDAMLSVYECETGLYRNDKDYFEQVVKLVSPQKSVHQCKDVLSDVKTLVDYGHRTTDKHLIAVKNGVFNKKTQTLENFDAKYVFFSKLVVGYNEKAALSIITAKDGYQWNVEDWLLELANNDQEVECLFWQIIADAIQGSYSRGKAIFFYSQSGNNGKGTLGQLIKNLLGVGNYSSLSIADFRHEFFKSQLVDATANIADENGVDQYIDSVRDFKASITGDDIIINGKFEKPYAFQYHGANIQMLNGLPRTRDKSDSFYRRIVLVPFSKSFQNNGERKAIKNEYIARTEVLEYVLKRALMINFEEFIVPKVSLALMEEYKEANNSVLEFWKEMRSVLVWDLVPRNFLYDLYKSWFYRQIPSGKVYSNRKFYENMNEILKNDKNWKTTENAIVIKDYMDADEPLITEYDLINWQDKLYTGKSERRLRDFKRQDRYRGFLRI